MDDVKIVGIVVPIVGAVAACIGGILKIWLDSRKKQQLATQEDDIELGNVPSTPAILDKFPSPNLSTPEEPSDDTKEIMTKEEIIETEMEGNFSSEETFGFLGIVPHRKSLMLNTSVRMSDELSHSTNNSNNLTVRDIKSEGEVIGSNDLLNSSMHYDSQAGYNSDSSHHIKVKVTKLHREQTVKSHKGSTTLSGSTELKSVSPPASPPASPPTLARSCPATKFKPKPIKQLSIESINDSASISSNPKIPTIMIVGENSEEE